MPRRPYRKSGTHVPAREPATAVGTWTWTGARRGAHGGTGRTTSSRFLCRGKYSLLVWEALGEEDKTRGYSGGAAVAMPSRGNCKVLVVSR